MLFLKNNIEKTSLSKNALTCGVVPLPPSVRKRCHGDDPYSRALPGMNGSVGVACAVLPVPVLHLPIDGRPALTPETTPFSIGDGLSALDDLFSFWWQYLRF
ncbi:hypothetical protein Bca4012_049736 [Brassica carinata]|uniref:Uncharacterized protein n=1 Tax=Brassica carinata TaxID=52824 RepID=A0A8X7R4J1_BRACI|nr:hypothetical protein Bca52824_052482 [Brassica carinata]